MNIRMVQVTAMKNVDAENRKPNVLIVFSGWFLLLNIIFTMFAVVMIVLLVTYFLTSSNHVQPVHKSLEPDTTENPVTAPPGGHLIFSKHDWSGVNPKYTKPLHLPTPFVVISHTASHACFNFQACTAQMQLMQTLHMESHHFPDIGYSFLVGGDGNIYEGRGWDVINMHSGFVWQCNIGISFIGNFVHDTPTNAQLDAAQELIELGIKLGKISEDYKLVPMNATFATLSPGQVLYGIIKRWPHFWTSTKDDVGKCPYVV